MARDNIKAIIERGRLIPDTMSHITRPPKDSKITKVDRKDLVEKPKQSKPVMAHRTMRGIRR